MLIQPRIIALLVSLNESSSSVGTGYEVLANQTFVIQDYAAETCTK